MRRKAKIDVNVFQSKCDQCANFKLKKSNITVTGYQKPEENDA